MNNPARALVATAAAAAVAVFAPAVGWGQAVKPNILIIFDTSGSMQANSMGFYTGYDGTNICGLGTDTRIYLLKKAIREALAQVGVDEANFGLMSFPTLVDPGATPVCYSCCSINGAGPTYAGHYYINNPEGDNGCGMTTHTLAGFPTTYAASWFDPGIPQALRVDVTAVAPGVKPMSSDFDPTDANIARVYKWLDNTEDTGPVAMITDPELHAMGATPLGRSLFFSRLYFENFIMPADARACRQNLVILVTDGAESCDGGATITPSTCAYTGSFFNPGVQACMLYRTDEVKTYVVTDINVGGTSNDTIAALGGTGSAVKADLTDSASVRAKLVEIIANAVPKSEICNGLDDNCNGLTDEGVSNKCPFDPGGLTHCAVESCNCLDDNCDGKTDEGLPTNACGLPCGCASPSEKCDGIDNNCNGDVDEGFDLGAACDNGLIGACKRVGTKECKSDGSGTTCSAPPAVGTAELCNNIDDDCDGMTDEDKPLPGEGEPCGVDLGACKAGKTICKMGKIVCDTMKGGTPEICNGIDDDCNGVIDDGMFPETGKPCVCPGLDPKKVDVGECKGGKLVCKGTMGFQCEGCVGPTAELCDGKDNDCDGMTDFKAACPDGFSCKDGQCAIPCGKGEFPCPSCYKCNPASDFCNKLLCCGVTCPPGHRCDEKDGKCKDLCAAAMCKANERCLDGVCLDCHSPLVGCPKAGDKCIGGVCKPDPCTGAKCGIDEYCDNGACVPLCSRKSCPAGQRCVAGNCRPDLCAGVPCPKNSFCDSSTGMCKDDPCATKQCPLGQSCVPGRGTCDVDPCQLIDCIHPCLRCEVTPEGGGQCVPDATCKSNSTTIDPGGGGGCGCRLRSSSSRPAHAPASASASILLVLLATRRWRRRR